MMLCTTLGDLNLHNCVYNASGPLCTTTQQLLGIYHSSAGAVLTKSCTLQARDGNQPPKYFYDDNTNSSINSNGLQNLGYQHYYNLRNEIIEKPYIISVSGLTLQNNLTILSQLMPDCCVELNLSCPNVPGHPQTGYDYQAMENVLRKVFEVNGPPTHTFGVKLPPYFDQCQWETVADILNETPIHFVVCVNSLGNGLVIDSERECVVIKPKRGLGGMGGSCIKGIALSNVYQFRNLLRDSISVVGCGGVFTGLDVFEHVLAGASAVQIGTCYHEEGVGCFSRITREIEDIMNQKGYSCVSDFRGKLALLD